MTEPRASLFFDFIDPLSYLLERELRSLGPSGSRVDRVGYELRPPPAPLTSVDDPIWSGRWRDARRTAAALGVSLDPHNLVPWSRKAHELHLLGLERGLAEDIRTAIYDAYFVHGRDIGRVDVLVDAAVGVGLDRAETKAALDVSRLEAAVLRARESAAALGIVEVPALWLHGQLIEGFRNQSDLGTLLRAPPPGR